MIHFTKNSLGCWEDVYSEVLVGNSIVMRCFDLLSCLKCFISVGMLLMRVGPWLSPLLKHQISLSLCFVVFVLWNWVYQRLVFHIYYSYIFLVSYSCDSELKQLYYIYFICVWWGVKCVGVHCHHGLLVKARGQFQELVLYFNHMSMGDETHLRSFHLQGLLPDSELL